MSKWSWDWQLEAKFKTLCEEFGGQPTFFLYHEKEERLGCELEDFDDFKSFAHWLNRQPKGHKTKIMSASHEYDEGSDTFTAKLEVEGEKPSKTLTVTNRRQIAYSTSLDEYISEELNIPTDEYHGDWGINFDSTYNAASSKTLINSAVKKPYLQQYATLDVDYNDNDEAVIARARIDIPITQSSALSSILQDAADAVEKLTDIANDAFYKKLEEEIARVGRRP